jgi:hypothetical protein
MSPARKWANTEAEEATALEVVIGHPEKIAECEGL